MASRKRGAFKPSTTKSKAKHPTKQCEFEVKVVGGINESSTSNAKVSTQDLVKRLKDNFSHAKETLKLSHDQGNKQYIKCKLLLRDVSTKYSAFYDIRKMWFSKVCQAGDPFWLESSEEVRNSYRFQANVHGHNFEPVSCSLGSFLNRGTFVEHYSTEVDRDLIEDQSLYAEFHHDTKVLDVSFYLRQDEMLQFFNLGKLQEIRLTFEYKQFENYVLVDEKQRGIVDIYIPLLRPPKVVKLAQQIGKDRTEEVRCVEFLSCSQQILGKSCVLKLSFESSDKPLELITRLAKIGRTIYYCAVNTIPPTPLDRVPKKPSFPPDQFHIAYALECLLSRGFKVSDRITLRFYQMLREATGSPSYPSMFSGRVRQLSSSQICRALYQLIAFVEANRFCPLDTILEQLLFGKFKKNVAIDFEIPKHYVYVPRIIITPTQEYLVQPELVAENRVVREYGHEFAMRIAFREEDFSKLTSFSESLNDVLADRVVGLLRKGFHLCGRHFKFLACSNSQLRDHGAWLYANDGKIEAEGIRQSLGKLDGIRCVATYVSRMGQCFSSTKESVKVTIDEGVETSEIPDISKDYKDEYFACCKTFRTGTYTFSDGIGKISQPLAKKIAKSLDLNAVPSAFQIRYAGCKGMLAIDTSLPRGRQILQYRQSMRKFDSEHEGLEICEHSKPNALYLNRQCITLLSGMGVPDEALIKLQDTMLIRLASMLLFESVALETLGKTSVPGGLKAKALRNSGIMVTCEPFFRSLLLAIYKSKLNDLLRRARIAIPHAHGRLLIGVLDESQTLEYGQVFIRYSKDISEPNKEYITLTGQVVVTKNPCFHPGDLRKFEAVDVKSLYHLVDCIVFPSKGPRPHTDEISGSDLDGDKYFATWYKPLIPPQPNAPPMDFPSAKKRVLDRKVKVNDMIEFVAEYIKNDQLGVIANAHLVHADSEDDGVKSDKCITLAHMHSDAVDFPKTGECPSLTPELRPDQYPDFMMKSDKPRYKSKKVIGKLFQKCNQLERARSFMASEESEDQEQVKMDQDLVLPGYEEFKESASERRDRYNTRLGSLMALYGLKDEGEVLTGCLTKVNSRLSGKTDEKFEVAQLIQASVASLRNNLKEEFYQEFGSEEDVKDYFQKHKEYPQDVLCKASAWYVVTYSALDTQPASQQATNEPIEEDIGTGDEWSMSDKPLLSFPWVVSPLLANIKSQSSMQTSQQTVDPYKELENISKLIIAQTKQMFSKENVLELMTEDFQTRHLWREQLPRCSSMCLLGASMTGLNILDKKVQPMQLYCHIRWDTTTEMEKAHLRKYEVFLRGSQLIKSLSIERYGHRDRGICLSFTTRQDMKHYIVANPFEMLKSFYIQAHIMQAPLLLPLLMVVMHWARKRYMTGGARDSFIEVEDLAVLFIKYCEHSQYIEEIQLDELKRKAQKFLNNKEEGEDLWKKMILESIEFTSQGFYVEPGLTLIKFWEFYGGDSGSDALHLTRIRNPVNPREKLLSHLKQEENQRFTDAALHTFHEIAQRRGLDTLLTSIEHENLKEVSETLTLPNCTWGSLRFAEDFVAHGLSTLTKAKVNIRSAPKGGGYIMEVFGNYISLSRCQAECHRLEAKTRDHFVYDHVIRSGNRFIFLDQESHDDRVTAKVLKKGDFAVNLTSLTSTSPGIQVDEIKLVSAVKEQVDVYKNSYLSYLHGSKDLRISLEYGSIYVTNAHQWAAGTTAGIVEERLSKKSNANRKRNRNANPEGKFVELQRGQETVAAKLPFLGQADVVKKEKIYVVELKISNNHKLKVVLDENLTFKGYQFEPFKWLDTRLKSRRPVSSRGSDVDLRIIMTTERDLTTEEYESLPIFETFGKTPILFLDKDQQLVITQEYRRRATHIYIIEVDTHSLVYNDSCFFLEVKKIKKHDAKRPIRYSFEKEFTSVKLYVDSDVDSTEKLAKDILSLGKLLKPSV